MYLKERLLISLNPQKFFSFWPDPMLTIFWVRKTVFSISEHRNLVNIIEDELFVELSTTSSLTDAFCSLSGTALGRSAGQKNVRKQHFCLQNFVAFITLI